MSLSDRDKKIALLMVPVVFVLAYWFLILTPKRDEVAQATQTLTQEREKADGLKAKAARLEQAKATFTRDYREVATLGKAIPSSVDVPSLIVQLDQAARGTGIKFSKIKAGERALASAPAGAAATPGSPPSGSNASGSNGTPASGGSAPTESGSGKIAQNANNSADAASQSAGSAEKTGAGAPDAQTSTSSKQGGLPVGGGATPGGAAGTTSTAPGLDSVPLEFKFDGSFFDLADFFHKLKRFVRVTNDDVLVQGRLMTIDSLKFASEQSVFPHLGVEVKATVYLSPKSEGTTAGATTQGPATTQTAAASSEDSGSPATSPSPTATATP